MEAILDKLKNKRVRNSTSKIYLSVWRSFNKFLIKLDQKPSLWEDRVALFCAYLIDQGFQSQTIKSYVSAIKGVLKDDGYNWNENRVLISSLTKACRLVNDKVKTRLPISQNLLEVMLFEIQRIFCNQGYLEALYKAIFAMGYYGLLRVGEMTKSQHVIKAKDVHIGRNKNKILLILYSSKTHGAESNPQQIKITGKIESANNLNFCPFRIMNQYLAIRGDTFDTFDEQFFIFQGKIPVEPRHARDTLNLILRNLGLNPALYGMHSTRIGRCSDLLKRQVPLAVVKLAGRWRSNAVYKYIKSTK